MEAAKRFEPGIKRDGAEGGRVEADAIAGEGLGEGVNHY